MRPGWRSGACPPEGFRWELRSVKRQHAILLVLGALGCEPTNTYLIDSGFSGPVVVVWGDPGGLPLDRKREIPVDKGRVFVSTRPAESFRARFLVNGVLRSDGADAFGFQNAVQYGGCGGVEGPGISEDSFFVGGKDEDRLRSLRKDMLVATLHHRGLQSLAECWASIPTSYFNSL